MVQNHILQLLCMIAMEAPTSFEANEIRNKKVDVLNAHPENKTEEVHDYTVTRTIQQWLVKGKEVPGYRQEKNVDRTFPG